MERNMSRELKTLHSHSGLERLLKFPKHIVLIDDKFSYLFNKDTIAPFRFGGIDYYKVNIMQFVKNGGVFKNLSQ